MPDSLTPTQIVEKYFGTTGLDKVKAYLGLSGTTQDAFVTDLFCRAVSEIEHVCSRNFMSASYSEVHNIESYKGEEGITWFYTDEYPVRRIMSITKTDFPHDDGVALVPADYYIDTNSDGKIIVRNPITSNYVKIEYVAGYSPADIQQSTYLPEDIQQLIIEYVAQLYRSKTLDRTKTSESADGYSVTYADTAKLDNWLKDAAFMHRKIRL